MTLDPNPPSANPEAEEPLKNSAVEPLPAPKPSAESPRIASQELFKGGRVVEITHAGETYRLLLTRNNRLILQK